MQKFSDTLPQFPSPRREVWEAMLGQDEVGAPKTPGFMTRDDRHHEALMDRPARGDYSPHTARPDQRWSIVSAFWHSDPALMNKAILEDIAGGSDAITVCTGYPGVPGVLTSELSAALNGVPLDHVRLNILPGLAGWQTAEVLREVVEARDMDPAALRGVLGYDPIGFLAGCGMLDHPAEDAIRAAATDAVSFCGDHRNMSYFMASGSAFRAGGATPAYELALVISTGLTYLRALVAAGLSVEQAAPLIAILGTADSSLFAGIAKFRALRTLWEAVLASCGAEQVNFRVSAGMHVGAMTQCDPWVNMLRAVAACWSAGLGGADSVTLFPYSSLHGWPDGDARRQCRNIHHILMDESHIAWVTDPAAGSYAIEQLTDGLVNDAWHYVQVLERAGGVTAALHKGEVQSTCRDMYAAHRDALSSRERKIVGVSLFPALDEAPLEMGDIANTAYDAPLTSSHSIEPLGTYRDSEDFEALRAIGQTYAEIRGEPLKIPVALLCDKGQVRERLGWLSDVLATGGLVCDVQEAADREQSAGPVILCGRDSDYAALQAPLNSRSVFIAGCWPDHLLADAPVDHQLFAGCDVIAVLRRLYATIGDIDEH